MQDVGAIRTLNGDLNTRWWRRRRPGHGWQGTKHTRIGKTTSDTTEQNLREKIFPKVFNTLGATNTQENTTHKVWGPQG